MKLVLICIIAFIASVHAVGYDLLPADYDPTTSAKRYNILSLDGAKYKGYMTARYISLMELKAYQIAVRDLCIPERTTKRIAMHELFDFIAGSETGAIIASTLVIPNNDTTSEQKNKYFAGTAQKFFETKVDTLYHDSKVSTGVRFLIISIVVIILCMGIYYVLNALFRYEGFEDRIMALQKLIILRKKQIKSQEVEEEELNECKQECK